MRILDFRLRILDWYIPVSRSEIRNLKSGFLLLLLCLSLIGCGPSSRIRARDGTPGHVPVIRVGILKSQDGVRVTGSGIFQVKDLSGGEHLGESGRGQVWKLNPTGAWIDVLAPDDQSLGLFTGPIRLTPAARGGRIWVSGREYRGVVDVMGDGAGKLTVINEVDVENYLRGVVPVEIGRLMASQIDAVKAQAIAARTYALVNRGRRSSSGFDILATVEDQVYQGYAAENRLTDKAIAETHGAIATYKGRMINTFYSSTCGGRTESIHDAWKSPPSPYLKSVKDRGRGGVFCEFSPVFRWTIQWDRATLERILSTTLPEQDRRINRGVELLDLRIRKRSRSGRVKVLEIKTRQGVVRVEGDRIRSVLRRPGQGTPPLRSTLFSLKIQRDRRGRPGTITASGGGFGHGIGLCQFGAIGMANRGYRFEQILRHYYRGVKIQRMY